MGKKKEVEFRILQNHAYLYAHENGFFEVINTQSDILANFILYMIENKMIPEETVVNPRQILQEFEDLFLDWFLFEEEYQNRTTIGRMYIESEDFKRDFNVTSLRRIRRLVIGLRDPIWGIFRVTKKLDKMHYWVRDLDTGSKHLVFDESTSKEFKGFETFYGKLIPFGDLCYIGSVLQKIPKFVIDNAIEFHEFLEILEERFATFMDEKINLGRRSQQLYDESLYFLQEFVFIEKYLRLDQVKDMDLNLFMFWLKWDVHLSGWKSTRIWMKIKEFLDFL